MSSPINAVPSCCGSSYGWIKWFADGRRVRHFVENRIFILPKKVRHHLLQLAFHLFHAFI